MTQVFIVVKYLIRLMENLMLRGIYKKQLKDFSILILLFFFMTLLTHLWCALEFEWSQVRFPQLKNVWVTRQNVCSFWVFYIIILYLYCVLNFMFIYQLSIRHL